MTRSVMYLMTLATKAGDKTGLAIFPEKTSPGIAEDGLGDAILWAQKHS